MPKYKPLYSLYKGLRESKYDVPDSYASFQKTLTQAGNAGAKSRRGLYQSLKDSNYDVPDTYEDFYKNLFVPVNSTTSRALKIGENPNTPTVNRYRQKMFNSVDPNNSRASELTHRAVGQAVRATNNVRKPVVAKVVNQKGKPTGKEFAITPAKTTEDLDREYAQETTKNWENELHDQMADADKDAAKISDMFKSFIGSTDEVGSVWGNMTRGGGIAGTPHSVTTNNGILENTEARQILAAGDYNRKRRELLQLEQDSRNGAIFDNHSFFRGMYDAAKDTGFLTGGASDLINAGSLLATKQDLDNGVHTEARDMLMQQAVKNSDAQSQYGDNQGWMYTGGVITTNMAPFMVQIGSAGFSKGMSNAIGKVVQGTASKVALGIMEKATGMAGAHIANYIGKVTGLTTKAFGKAVQYGIVGAAQANTVGLGNVANDVINRYTGQVYQDEQGNYKFGTFDSDGNLVHEGGEDFLTALVKGDAAQTIEFATELAGGGIDAAGTALKNFVTKGGKKIINKYNMENVSKVIDFLLNNKVSKNARYLKAGADRTLGKVEVNSIVGESLEEELGIIANTVFTGDNKISDLWDEKQQSQIWGGMLLSIGLMKGAVAPFHAYNAKQYYSYKHKLDKADVNLSQLLGKEKWEELRNQIDATTNDDMPEMINKINRDVALGKNRQPVREYIQNLLIMRGYDIGNMLAAKKAVEDKGEGVSVKNMEKNQAYQQGRDAYGYDTHEIQLDQEDKQKSLAQLLGISEQQLASMSDEELEALSGRDDNIDRAIYDYQLSTARYEGVIDNARDQIDLEVQRAAQAVDMYTDKSSNTIRNATIKATGGLEDYGVYIINGNIATHEDGSIDISNSDDMILYYDPTTNTVEHADAMMFAELGSEENADEVRSQAMADAKEKAIKETTGIIDGVVEVGTQFNLIDTDGTEHTYEVLADNGDGTAMITIDGNVPTELVNGENVNIPVSFEELQKMKDEYDQQRLQAAKAEREQMEKERAEQQTQEIEETQPSFDFNQILNDNGNVVLVDVLGKDGNTKYPDSRLFLIRDAGAKAKVVELKSDGTIVPHAVNKEDVATITSMSLDEYKQAMPESSMIEDNSGEESDEDSQLANLGLPKGSEIWMGGDGFGRPKENTQSKVVGIDEQGSIILEDKDGKTWSASFDYINNHRELPPSDEITNQSESNTEENTPAPEQTPAMTLEDGTIVPMLEDGNPDFSKLTAAQTAELYDTQFGEDADSIVSGYVSDAKKALDKASNMTVKGKTFVEQKAAKAAKEKAIADAQAAYDSAIAIRDAYNERQLAKVEDTAEGRKKLIEKARRKFARLKSAVKDDAEAVSQLYRETIGSLLHRLYDGTGIDVTDTTPLTAEEYVASNLGAHSLNYEGTETSKGVKQETGLSREDFAKTQLLAADGKGTTIDALVHSLWENRPSNLESLDTQDIRNALIGVLNSGFKASEARNFVENIRIAQAENILEEQKRAQENAAYAEQHKAEPEAELEAKSDEKAELKAKSEAKLDNESDNKSNDLSNETDNEKINDNINDNINAPEVPEDATDENPLGLQLSEDKVPFEIEGGKSGETYDINDNKDRQRLINDNKVDDKDILDIDMPKHVHKAIKELCKKMGLKVQFLYMGARSNGWIENGTMYLALDTEKATQFVFGHEMTHAIKQKNPEAYKELVKVAMAVTTKKKFEEDLAKVYQNYHGISGYNNVDDYVEEVVADNLGKFINDFDLAQKFSLRLNHPILGTILHAIQKIKSLLYGDFYKSVDALERIVEKAYVDTANGQVTNSETGEDVSFSLRQKPEPKKKGVGYKVFVLKDGKLYPPMVANPNGAATPVGVWLDADAAPIAGESKTGRPQVKQGGKGTQGGSGKLAYRPGWHLGVVPYAIQFNRKDADGNKTLFPKNFVFAEVEYAADVDYQEEARQEGINPSGKYQHSLAGLKHLPTDGYYMYRTNPNPETDPWVITGAMKVNRILTRAEQAELVKNAGREPQQIQEGDIVTDDVVNSINQEIADAPKFSLKDNQENPLNQDGTLKLDKIKSVDELTDEDFTSAFRNVELPAIPKNVDAAIGANGKPIVIKKNIFEKNWNAHKFTPAESKKVLNDALYNTDLVGHTQPTKKPNHWVAIKLDDKSPITVLEVNDNKNNVEVVGWYTLDERNLGRIKRQAERNGGELIMLTPKDDKVESLSTPPLSSAAKIDNSSETAKENGEKFSLKNEKTMFGMHNISVDKLRKAIKQGGFAAPSMGVVDSKNGIYSDYGEITLIPKAEKLAKRTGKNAGTFTADAWTPTYPQVERIMNKQGEKAFNTDMNVKLGDVDNGIYSNVRESWKGYLSSGNVRDGLYWHYLFDNGMNPETIYQTGKYDNDITNEVMRISDNGNKTDYTDKEVAELIQLMNKATGKDNDVDAQREKLKARIASAEKQGNHLLVALKKKRLEELEGVENFYIAADFVNDVVRNNRKNGKVDVHDTMGTAKKKVEDNKKLSDDFPSWLDKKTEEYGVEEMLYNGTTPSGKPKYIPNTIENAVKLMKKQGVAGGYTAFGSELGVFIAKNSPEVNTLAAMKNAKDKLIPFGDERHNQIKDKITKEFLELSDEIRVGSNNRYAFDDSGVSRMVELTDHKGNEKEYLKKAYNIEVSDEWMDRYNKLLDTIKKDYKVFYFETKFMRPYGLDEFEKAIVPSDTPSDVIDALKKAGIDVSSYERGNAEDRQKVTMDAINSSDDIRFSLKSMMAKPEGWKQANKKAIHIAEAIERDPKFSLKNLDGTLIKAGTYFSGGGLVEEGLKGIIDPVVAVEYDEKISGVYRNNFGQHIVTADVRDVDPKELVKQIDGEVEYFHASPVCKNYSQAKSNHAEVELDKETAASTAEFINAIKPKVVTIENVKGYKDSDAMKTITDALDANGYTWDADVYNAADYGGYTNRERLIVRAVRDGKLPEKPKKMARKSGWYEAVADIIPTLTEKKNGVAPWMDIRLKADGIDWKNIDKPLYVMGSAYADGKVPHAFADELLPTLRTKSGDVIVMPDGKVYRAMGRVLARVSGVSDDYKMPFSENLSHTIIGNGIPTQLTEHVIAPLLTGSDPKFSIRTYHGTGASFDKFDFSHMGEGEGSQAFGWGGYVTNSKDIAEDYTRRAKIRKDNGGFEFVTDMSANNKDMVRQYIYKHKDVNKGLDAMRKDLSSALEMFPDDDDLKELSNILAKKNEEIAVPDNIAYLYDVDIPDDNGDYLDWDAPLTDKQKNTIIKELRRLKIDFADFKKRGFSFDGSFGGNAYDFLMYALRKTKKWKDVNASRAVSKFLSSIGFTGIKYKAGTIFGGAKEGDYNYVIFDENNANIVGNTRFSLRYDQFEHDLNQWKKDNNLPKDAQRPTIPQRNAGESAVDFLRRVDEYRKQMALWKTAPTYEQHLLSDDTALGEFNRELQRGSVLKRIAFQDSMLAIRKAQEAIMKEVGVDRLNMAEDAYTAENRSHGKGKNEFEEYNNEFLQPLRKAYHQMKKILGDSYDNVRIYMMAKHGLERDAQIAFKKSLDADFEDVAQRSAAYRAYKGDMNRITNDSDLEFGRVDFTTWRQRDNALRTKYSPSYMDYRYDENGIAYDYSGLSALFGGSDFEEAAYKLVRDIESSHVAEVQDLWNATNSATKKILRDGYKAGMMSKDTYLYVRDMYSHYIPLRGWDGTTADQVWDYIGGGKGAFNQTLKKAHGRTSIADDPIAYIENMAESGILLNNKNWVKQHLMLLAQNHPTSLLTLSKAWYVKSVDDNGNEEWIPATPHITSQMNSNQVKAAIDAFEKKMEQMAQTGDATQKRDGLNIAYPQTHSEEREHEVRVMKDGEEYVIYVNGDPQLAQAMNNTRAHRVSEGIKNSISKRVIAVVGRKMAAAYTSLSPLFIPSNYFRDLTMTLASTAIREDAKYNYLLIKNLTTSWNLGFMLRDFQNGKLREKVSNGNATKKEQMFYDFMINGGETGFVSSLDVEDLKKKFKNDLKDLDRWKANPVKVGHTIMDSIEFLNRMIEDSNRFAVYMTSIQYGRSIDEAVNDAKNVTLNFNRKGTGEHSWQTIRNLYLFINPAVQSLQTLGALAKHHPFKFTAVTASWIASGVLVPIVNAALMQMAAAFLGGDGDDDKDWYKDISKKYWQFTKWDRRNNFIMWVPTTHEFVKIPLAQEFRAFYGLGDMIASKMMGGELADESWEDYGWDLVGQVVDMLPLDPTGYDGNIAVSLMPNAIRPVFELAFNVDFTGKPLFKETEYNKYDPNFTKAYVGTPDWLVRASRMMNSIGNDYPNVQQNKWDALGNPRYNLNNPAVVDHVLSSYLGGAYTMGSQVLGLLTKSLNDPKEIKVADIPLFSKFVSNPDDRPVTKKQGDEFWNMKENHDRAANTLSKLKKQAKVDGDYSMLERFYGSEEYKKYKQDDVKVKKYEEDKKKERAEESGEEYRPHKLNAEDIYKAHATPKDDFEDLKLKQLYTKLNGFKTSYDLLVDTAPSQSDGYYNNNKAAIDAIDEISLDKQEISELKKGFLDDGKDAYNAEDMKQIRDLRKKILAVLEKANKVVVASQKAKAEK